MQAAINMGFIWKVEIATWRGIIHALLHRLWQYMCNCFVFVKNKIWLNKLVVSIFRYKIGPFNINVMGYRHTFLQNYSILWYIWYMDLFVSSHCVHWKKELDIYVKWRENKEFCIFIDFLPWQFAMRNRLVLRFCKKV